MRDAAFFDDLGRGHFPAHLGLVIAEAGRERIRGHFAVRREVMAPNGFLHAGAVVTLADTCAGYGCVVHLPEGASGFTTIELKSNHLGTTRDGNVDCEARPVHIGKSTQVWDATVTHRESGRTLALFRCTQMVLYPRPGEGGA